MTNTELDSLNQESDEQAPNACGPATPHRAGSRRSSPVALRGRRLPAGHAERAARALDWAEVRRPSTPTRYRRARQGASTEAQWSRRAVRRRTPTPHAGRPACRQRGVRAPFGHVFLIRAAGRRRGDGRRAGPRLANDEARERAEVTEQLAQITRLRLQTLLAG